MYLVWPIADIKWLQTVKATIGDPQVLLFMEWIVNNDLMSNKKQLLISLCFVWKGLVCKLVKK